MSAGCWTSVATHSLYSWSGAKKLATVKRLLTTNRGIEIKSPIGNGFVSWRSNMEVRPKSKWLCCGEIMSANKISVMPYVSLAEVEKKDIWISRTGGAAASGFPRTAEKENGRSAHLRRVLQALTTEMTIPLATVRLGNASMLSNLVSGLKQLVGLQHFAKKRCSQRWQLLVAVTATCSRSG